MRQCVRVSERLSTQSDVDAYVLIRPRLHWQAQAQPVSASVTPQPAAEGARSTSLPRRSMDFVISARHLLQAPPSSEPQACTTLLCNQLLRSTPLPGLICHVLRAQAACISCLACFHGIPSLIVMLKAASPRRRARRMPEVGQSWHSRRASRRRGPVARRRPSCWHAHGVRPELSQQAWLRTGHVAAFGCIVSVKRSMCERPPFSQHGRSPVAQRHHGIRRRDQTVLVADPGFRRHERTLD